MNRWPGPGHQSDPLDAAFVPRRPFWVSMLLGAAGGLVLLGIVVYAVVD